MSPLKKGCMLFWIAEARWRLRSNVERMARFSGMDKRAMLFTTRNDAEKPNEEKYL